MLLSSAVAIGVYIAVARSPPRSETANNRADVRGDGARRLLAAGYAGTVSGAARGRALSSCPYSMIQIESCVITQQKSF
jgi:hypothetical protein